MYQAMDAGFLGLILSTFNQDAGARRGSLQLTAFQAATTGSGLENRPIPVDVVHPRSW